MGQGLRAPRRRRQAHGRGDDVPEHLHGGLCRPHVQSQGGHADVSFLPFSFFFAVYILELQK